MIKKTVSVIGSSGFIGRHLTEYLESKGHHVYSLGRQAMDAFSSEPLNSVAIESDVVIWAAAKVNPKSAENSPELVNSELSDWVSFLEKLTTAKAFQGTVYFLSSGGCVYNSTQDPFDETSTAEGNNRYGHMKVEMENALVASGLNWVVLRLANVYGPNQPHGRGQGVIAEWLHSLQIKMPLNVIGELDSYRDYLHIQDLVQTVEQLISLGMTNEIYNIGSGLPVRLSEILEMFSNYSPLVLENTDSRPFDRKGYWLCICKIRSLGLQCAPVPIEAGISQLFRSELFGDKAE
jgi:UDP-glucose 4-epimerase